MYRNMKAERVTTLLRYGIDAELMPGGVVICDVTQIVLDVSLDLC